MNRIVKHSDKHPIVNADLFIETSLEENRLVCLSDRDVFIIRSYLWPFVDWATRLARPVYGDYWQLSTDSELGLFKEACQSLDSKLGVRNVDCINEKLTEIALAIREVGQNMSNGQSVNCCCGSGSGNSGQHSPDYDPTEVPEVGAGDPPTGFESWEQFTANKCAVATDIVQTLIGDINRMGTLNLVGLTLVGLVGGLVPVLLTPVPYDDIVVIAAVLLTVLGMGATLLDKMGSVLSDHTSDFVCVLYTSISASDASAAFKAKFAELWETDGYDPLLGFSANSAISALVGSSVTNRLFKLETTRNLPEGDCSECEECGYLWDWAGEQLPDWTLTGTFGCSVEIGESTNPEALRLTATPTTTPFGYFYYTDVLPFAFDVTESSQLTLELYASDTTTLYIVGQVESDPGVWKYFNGAGTWSAGDSSLGAIFDDYIGETITHVGIYAAWSSLGNKIIDLKDLTWVC